MKLRFRLDAQNKGLEALFGELEAEIMQILWEKGALKGREIYEEVRKKREIAYTTVLTVLERLSKKGFIKKKKGPRSTEFISSISKEDFKSLVTYQLIRSALNISESLAISNFIDIFSEMHPEELEKLSKFIKERLSEKNKDY